MRKRWSRKSVKRWGGLWTFLLIIDIIKYVRRRDRRVITRRVLKDGDVLVVSSTVSSERK